MTHAFSPLEKDRAVARRCARSSFNFSHAIAWQCIDHEETDEIINQQVHQLQIWDLDRAQMALSNGHISIFYLIFFERK